MASKVAARFQLLGIVVGEDSIAERCGKVGAALAPFDDNLRDMF